MGTPLRICLCTTFYPPYSGDADGAYAHRLANALARLGHHVTVVHNPGAYESLRQTPVAGTYSDHENVEVRPVSARLGALGLLAIHQTGRPVGLKAQLDEALRGPFDIIHYHNVSLLGGPTVFGLGESKVKIGSLNDHWLVCPMHLLWKYTGEVCDQPRCFTCSVRQGRPPQLWRRTGLLANRTRQVEAFLAPSVFTIRAHLERGFSRPMIHLPPLHPPPQPNGACLYAEPRRRPYFLCVGRLEDYKGFQDVVPMFRQFPGHDLIICGDGSFRNELLDMAAGLSNVRVIAALPPDRLHALYQGAVATIVPSRCVQTFCHVTAESWSAGTPVIAFRRSAVEEIVAEHGGGILYDRPDQLVAAMANLIDSEPSREGLQSRARSAFEQEFSEASYSRRYLRIVTEMLALKRDRRTLSEAIGVSGQFAGRRVFGV
jgi:glycosyltransferase involved in cell wall biosynthesis